MQYIESRSNAKIKEVTFLKDRKEREKRRLFFFEGVHLFDEFIKRGNRPEVVFATEEALEKHREILSPAEDALYVVTDSVYRKITGEKAPQGILCVSPYLKNIDEAPVSAAAPPLGGILLESVRDAGNLGAIIRTAAALGIENVMISRDCADLYSPKTVRAAMGALFSVRLRVYGDIRVPIKALADAGRRVFAACLRGNTLPLGGFEILPGDFFVFGNEGAGVTEETANLCAFRARIPMARGAESLNVAAASAVIMWEMAKAAN